MPDLTPLKATNARRWSAAKPTRSALARSVAQHLLGAKPRYVAVSAAVEKATGNAIPWWFIACVHEREASQNWNTQLGQGDPLHSVSVHVPAGRGPFETWEDGALDALIHCPPYTARNRDWSVGGTLTAWEEYNGLAYSYANRPSPYVFAGTSVYDPPNGPGGKVVRDHGPIENVTDSQLGCAAMLIALMVLDPSIDFGGKVSVPTVPSPPLVPKVEPPKPAPAPHPAAPGFWARLSSIFIRKD